MFILTIGSALALDCTGREPATCAAANSAVERANAYLDGAYTDDHTNARRRTDTVYEVFESIRENVACANPTVAITGSAGGRWNLGTTSFSGTFGPVDADASGTWHGSVVQGSRTFEGTWDDGAGSGTLGDEVASYNDDGQLVGNRDDGFLAGSWVRIAGRRGTWVVVYGDCSVPVEEGFEDWFDGGLGYDGPVTPAEDCSNGVDDDGDGRTDCDDPTCDTAAACPEACADGIDNDGDGRVDCRDGACAGVASCVEICDDGIDNDADMWPDCFDADCAHDRACGTEICDDGVDNDADFAADCSDPDCVGTPGCGVEICDNGLDDDADGTADCADPDCAASCVETCSDGTDEDQDGRIDCLDTDCIDTVACARSCVDTVVTATTTVSGSTRGLSDERQPSGCAASPTGSGSDHTVEFVAPTTGIFTFHTEGSDFDTVLYASAGGACGDEELACDDDAAAGTASELYLFLVAGESVFVTVDGFDPDADGSFTLHIE